MKTAVLLCLLAFFCTADATIFKILRIRVKNAKSTVEKTVRQLESLRNDIVQETDLTVTKKWLELLEMHRNHMNPILDTIRKDVENANNKGKNAQHCYDAALDIIRSVDRTTHNNAEQCKQATKVFLERNLCFINDLILTGQKLIMDLDNIFPKCDNALGITNIFKRRKCIVDKLDVSNTDVKNLQRDANSSKYNAKIVLDVVNSQSSDCLDNIYSDAHLQLTGATSTVTRCLEML